MIATGGDDTLDGRLADLEGTTMQLLRQALLAGGCTISLALLAMSQVAAAGGALQVPEPDPETLPSQFLGTFEGQASEQQVDPTISTNEVKVTYSRTYAFSLTTEPLGDIHWKIRVQHRVRQEGVRTTPFAMSSESVRDFDCDLIGKSRVIPETAERFLPMFEMNTSDDQKNAIDTGSNIQFAPRTMQCQMFRTWWVREHGLQRFKFTPSGDLETTMTSPMYVETVAANTLTWTLRRQAPSSTGSASTPAAVVGGAAPGMTRDCIVPTTACSAGCSATQQRCSARLSSRSPTYIRDNSKCVNDLYTCVARCSAPYYQCLSTASDEPPCRQTLYGCLSNNPGGTATATYQHGCFDSYRHCH
jgi:hypothetical protein